MIQLTKIKFAYGDNLIINDLSLSVKPGEWLGLIGPNGSGKTTLLNIISGLLHPISGETKLNQKDIIRYSRKEIARMIAVVPQTSPFPFAFTALEIVLMGRHPYIKNFGFETGTDLKIAKEKMIQTDTWQFRGRRIDELSGGERQRVLIARALTQQPKILLLDEPTTFLDIKHQLNIMEILYELNRKTELTIISAIHDINLAISYCTEIALMKEQTIYKHGEPTEIITYANLKETFSAEIYVGVNEFTGKPYYIPMKKDS